MQRVTCVPRVNDHDWKEQSNFCYRTNDKKRTKQYLVKEIIVTFITTALTEWILRFFGYYSIFLREFERIPRKRGEAKLLVVPTNESLNNSIYRNIADNVFFFFVK